MRPLSHSALHARSELFFDDERGRLTARRLAAEYDLDIDFIEGDAEVVTRQDGAYDFAVSEYGAANWCDPDVWVRETWRLLRPGGELAATASK